MTTPPISQRQRTFLVLAAFAVAGLLPASTVDGAYAVKHRVDPPVVVERTVRAVRSDQSVERPCFITPAVWNESLDGPLPRCRTSGS